MNPTVILESRTLRDELTAKTYVLEKVKFLRLLPDNQHATTEMVANYYEVPEKTVQSVLRRHRDEFLTDGYKVLTRNELFNHPDFATFTMKAANIASKSRRVALFPRRAILRMGMLLEESEVAAQVRTYLLDAEHVTTAQDLDRVKLELALLKEKYAFKELEIRELQLQAEREKNQRLLEAVLKLPLSADFQKAVISRLAGLEVQPTAKYYATEELAGKFTFEFGTKITGMRLAMLAKAHGVRPDREAGEMENEFAVVSVAPAVNKKTGRVIEGKVVEQILYKEAAVPVLRSLVRQWLDTQPVNPRKKPRKSEA